MPLTRLRGEESGRASNLTADVKLMLTAVSEQQTDVVFTSHVIIVGRLGKFAGGVMNKLADSISDQFVVAFRQQLEPQPEVPVAAAPTGLWVRLVALPARIIRWLLTPYSAADLLDTSGCALSVMAFGTCGQLLWVAVRV